MVVNDYSFFFSVFFFFLKFGYFELLVRFTKYLKESVVLPKRAVIKIMPVYCINFDLPCRGSAYAEKLLHSKNIALIYFYFIILQLEEASLAPSIYDIEISRSLLIKCTYFECIFPADSYQKYPRRSQLVASETNIFALFFVYDIHLCVSMSFPLLSHIFSSW